MWTRTYFVSLSILTLTVGLLIGPDCNPPPVSSVRLVDANGQDLGMGLLQEEGRWRSYHEGLALVLHFGNTNNLSSNSPQIGVFFTEQHCQGDAYHDTPMGNVLRVVRIFNLDGQPVPESIRYFAPSSPAQADVSVESAAYHGHNCLNVPGTLNEAWPASEVSLPFNVPVAMPLRMVPPTETP